MKVYVHDWRYEDGWKNIPQILRRPGSAEKEYNEQCKGWFCRVYTDDRNFEIWMRENMKGEYDCTIRFNSGNPMHLVWIRSDEDATLFKLTWM